jgi:very-short-patch-repair endonuclease
MSERLGTYPPKRDIERARELRRDSTHPERLLWSALRGRRFAGVKFRRQVPIGSYVVDFLCEEKSLVVEIDGSTHEGREAYDAQRTTFLKRQGLRAVRVSNDEVLNNLEGVVWLIAREMGITLPDRKPSPLPPLPGGEGTR